MKKQLLIIVQCSHASNTNKLLHSPISTAGFKKKSSFKNEILRFEKKKVTMLQMYIFNEKKSQCYNYEAVINTKKS